MTDSTLVFSGEGRAGKRLIVNFCVYSGREATEAEIHRLGQSLLEELDSFEIIAQRRFEFAPDVEATVHQVYVELPREVEDREDRLIPLVEDWAEDAIGERHKSPDLLALGRSVARRRGPPSRRSSRRSRSCASSGLPFYANQILARV